MMGSIVFMAIYLAIFERDDFLDGTPTVMNLLFGTICMFYMLSLLAELIVWIVF